MSGLIDQMRRIVKDIIGDDQQAKDVVYALISELGGDRLYLPGNDYEMRNREIKELKKHGSSKEQLAKRYRLSVRTIDRILKS